ncbi:MAG: hypothetical protein ACYDFT_00090 [Thermoplasmata archaeon]
MGVSVDRWDRRQILLLTNIVEGIVVGGLAILLLSGRAGLDLLVVVAFLLGADSQWIRIASGAMVPTIVQVEDLPRRTAYGPYRTRSPRWWASRPAGSWSPSSG